MIPSDTIYNNILDRYSSYLDVLDGSNEVLVDTWLDRIDRGGGNGMTKKFLASSKSRGELQRVIETADGWEAA